MAEKYRVKWNREETILAFELYCRTPFGKIHTTNPEIIELANLLGRTPAAVVFKMSNLAHFDPELQKREIKGFSNASKLDEEIFTEFSNDWDGLSYEAQKIKASMNGIEIQQVIDLGDIDSIPPGEYREHIVKSRVGQHFFRQSVLNSYGRKCCITGLSEPELLIASHIKPWNVSNVHTERTNPRNGLCLNSIHDKAFDRGFITITPQYKVEISTRLHEIDMDIETRQWFMSYQHRQISLPDKFLPGKEFIEYHNDVIFKG